MLNDLDKLAAWLLFFRDIGVNDLTAGQSTRIQIDSKEPSPPGDAVVLRKGPSQADLAFVWDLPHDEGHSEALLVKMIGAMGYRPEDVLIIGLPGISSDERVAETVEAALKKELLHAAVRVAVAQGADAVSILVGSQESIGQLRGRFHEFDGVKIMPTYHPSLLIESPSDKRDAWQDLQMVMDVLGKKAESKSKK